MSGNKKIIYWDSCIFMSWLKDEKRSDPQDMAGVRDVVERMKRREVTIVTSTITQAEVGACNVGQLVLPLFDDLMKRKNIQRISVDIKIASMARALRDYYRNEAPLPNTPQGEGKRTLSPPDAIHLATAILNKVDVFHTFDKLGDSKTKTLGLIPLSRNVAGHNLIIEKPAVEQFSFNFNNKLN